MKKIILTLTIAASCLTVGKLNAQMPYNFSVSTDVYQPLTSGTVLNDTTVWDDETYKVNIPFTFNLNNKPITQLLLESAEMALPDSTGIMDGLTLISADLIDRGIIDSLQVSKSPIRYQIEGMTGNRILKIEIANAGFADEYYSDSTVDDYFNMQVWLYESGNIIEYRYGRSSISDFSTYFPIGNLTGFVKNIDFNNVSFDMMYILSGNPSAPVIDSMTPTTFKNGLSAMPDSGTVYRFTPKPTGISEKYKVHEMNIYPTLSTGILHVENPNVAAATYKVYSLSGDILKYGNIAQGINTIEISDAPAGHYILRLDHDAGFETHRFIKL